METHVVEKINFEIVQSVVKDFETELANHGSSLHFDLKQAIIYVTFNKIVGLYKSKIEEVLKSKVDRFEKNVQSFESQTLSFKKPINIESSKLNSNIKF